MSDDAQALEDAFTKAQIELATEHLTAQVRELEGTRAEMGMRIQMYERWITSLILIASRPSQAY